MQGAKQEGQQQYSEMPSGAQLGEMPSGEMPSSEIHSGEMTPQASQMSGAETAMSQAPAAEGMMPPGMMGAMGAEGMPTSAGTEDMPTPPGAEGMQTAAGSEDMPTGSTAKGDGQMSILVELRVPAAESEVSAKDMALAFSAQSFQLDPSYEPVPVTPHSDEAARMAAAGEKTLVVRGTIRPEKIPELEAQPNVVKVWKDTPIAGFSTMLLEEQPTTVTPVEAFGTCPIGTCDCSPSTAKGTIGDVANYLGVNSIWANGYRGDGIVVGVVDGGITAQGRTISGSDTSNPAWPNKLIPHVIGGWPASDWGTTGVDWGWHANMCSTDVLGMAPHAQIYDIRIASGTLGGTISNALAGFQWAINQHKANGTPQILTNSWGIFQEAWDTVYAHDPNHPFTRKVVEALDEGIMVLFAAGNCGDTCPDSRCGSDVGPGKSIWGANGHPRVMTVGAVNKNEQFVGYSSEGPAALDPNKPDFCSITHFKGFFNSDSGTSAATPICAGVVALLKQAKPALTQDAAKNALKNTAKNIGPAGWDQYSGEGIIQAKAALNSIVAAPEPAGPVVAWGANRLDAFVIGTNSALYHKWWNGSAWGPSVTGYEYMGGISTSRAEVASWGPNRLDVFLRGADYALSHKWWNGSSWGPSVTGYENMGGVCTSPPEVVTWGPNRLDVFVLGTNSALYHKWWNGSAWGPSVKGYEYMGGICTSPPEAVAWGPNRLDVFVLGTSSALYHKWWNGSAWGPSVTGYEYMGGVCSSPPSVVAWGPNRLDVFVLGTNKALYHKWWNGSAWGPSKTGYEYLGGTCLSRPTVVSWGSNRLDIFVLGTNRALYHKWWNGSAWGPSLTGWEYMGGVCTSPPSVSSWSANRLDVFVKGTDSALYHKWWNGSSWGPSVTGWQSMGGVITEFSSDCV
jgi:serine protease AprX